VYIHRTRNTRHRWRLNAIYLILILNIYNNVYMIRHSFLQTDEIGTIVPIPTNLFRIRFKHSYTQAYTFIGMARLNFIYHHPEI